MVFRRTGAGLVLLALVPFLDAAEAERKAPAGRKPVSVRVVQLNPYYAGRLAPYNEIGAACRSTPECQATSRRACRQNADDRCWECIDGWCRERNFGTAKRAAGLFRHLDVDVVGMQELHPDFAPRIERILEEKTGGPWSHRVAAQGVDGKGSGVGVYWRTDRIELVNELGHVDVDTLPSRYVVRFHGSILKHKASDRQFGFFSGKLVWPASGDDARREAEAKRLRRWIDEKMAGFPSARARILATDLNDTRDSKAYRVFADYDDGGGRKNTSPGLEPRRRIDYLFWADGPRGASSNGFITRQADGRLGRSEFFGSDHRFVYGDARLP